MKLAIDNNLQDKEINQELPIVFHSMSHLTHGSLGISREESHNFRLLEYMDNLRQQLGHFCISDLSPSPKV